MNTLWLLRISEMKAFGCAVVVLSLFASLLTACRATSQQQRAGLPDNWWQHLNGIRMIYGVCLRSHAPFAEITASLDELYENGFRAINLFTAYHGEPKDMPYSFCGLAPLDYYSIDPIWGTEEDFDALAAATEEKGMALMTWINLGYTSSMSDYWRQAQEDKAAGLSTKYSNSFIWLDEESQPTDDVASSAYSEIAGSWYRTAWGQPAYNWESPEWREEAANILNYWIDRGIDGFVLDAPVFYQNLHDNHRLITDAPDARGNIFLVPEAVSANAELWIAKHGYNHVYDNEGNDSGTHDAFNFASLAVRDGSAEIEAHLQAVRDVAVSLGGGSYIYDLERRRYGKEEERILEAAVITGNGVMYELGFGLDYMFASEAAREGIHRVLRAVNANPALAPGGGRQKLNTNDDARYYAVLRTSMDGAQHALAIYNFTDQAQTITVDLVGSGIMPQTPADLLNGGGAPEITSTGYAVTLPPYGFAFYEVTAGE